LTPRPTISLLILLLGAILASCTNPFAPRLEPALGSGSTTLGDSRTLDGIFQNIRYAYTYRDTLIYGNLLHPDFQFRYYNPDRANYVAFNRDEEMRITYNLFKGADRIDLQWNEILLQEGDSVKQSVTRAYTLTIALQANENFRIDGRATLQLVRNSMTDPWLIRLWSDDSNF
jgi:hypothetical protein